jgi:proteasome activator subunit 4
MNFHLGSKVMLLTILLCFDTFLGNKSHLLDMTHVVKWITATMGQKSSTQKYLDQMFRALESYYHPANFGRHSLKLIDFLARLTNFFIRRLHK